MPFNRVVYKGFFFLMPSFLGIYIRPGLIEFSEADNSENSRFVSSRSFPTDSQAIDIDSLFTILKDKNFGLKKNYEGIAFSISLGNDIYRKMTFPFVKDQVEKTIRYEFFDQVKDSLQGAESEYFFDYQILSSADQKTTALGVCCHEKIVKDLVYGLEKIDLDPEKIIPELSAVATYLRARIPIVASGNSMVLHTTPEDVYFILLKQGQIFEFRQLKIKLGDIHARKTGPATSSIVGGRGKQEVASEFEEEEKFYKIISFTNQEIEDIKSQVTEVAPEGVVEPSVAKKNALKRLLIQLQRTLFLTQDVPGELVITGTYSNDKELIDALNKFGLKVFDGSSELDLEHATSLGAVQSFFDKDFVPLNFRQGSIEYKGFFEKVVPPLILCMVFLLSITLVMNFFLIQKNKSILAERKTYWQHSLQMARAVDPANELFKKNLTTGSIENEIVKIKRDLDFQANVNEYEKKYPIISSLKIWLEYEKTKNKAMGNKIAVAGEQSMIITQTQTGVRMDVSKARAATFEDAIEFIKTFKLLKYFDDYKEKGITNVAADNDVVFDFWMIKNYAKD